MAASRKIQWQNKYSGETGFVKAVREAKKYFENGTVDEAKNYRSNAECEKAIEILNRIGEGDNNNFIITDAAGRAIAG